MNATTWGYVALGLVLSTLVFRWSGVMVRRLNCGCPLRHWSLPPRSHPREAWLLLTAITQTAAMVIYVMAWHEPIDAFFIFIMVACASLDWIAWWVHSKNSRKKLKDKILGVVTVTAAGLKVRPTPA